MVQLREVERQPRTVSDEPVVNEYTDLILELDKLEKARVKGGKRTEAVIEQDELPAGTEPKEVRKALNATARTHGIGLNIKSAKEEWPIVFAVSIERGKEEAPKEAPAAPAAGKAAA